MCDACFLLIKAFQEEQSSFGKGINGSHRSHFSGGCTLVSGGVGLFWAFTWRSCSNEGWGCRLWRLIAGTGCLEDAVVPRHPCTFLLLNDPWNFLWEIASPKLLSGDNMAGLAFLRSQWLVQEWAPKSQSQWDKDNFAENSREKLCAFLLWKACSLELLPRLLIPWEV